MIREDALKTQMTSSTKWLAHLSYDRVIACFAIVLLHTLFAANEYFAEAITQRQDVISRAVENNLMWAVPVFLMVTGALQLNPEKELPLKKLYTKYIARVFIALIFFSIVFRLFDMIMDGEVFSVSGILYAFSEIMNSKGWGHLWYLYLLIGIYVMLPFYRKIASGCSDEELKYLLAVYVVFLSLFPLIEKLGINIPFYICVSLIYPMYLFAGYMIKEKKLVISNGLAILMISVASVLLIILSFLEHGKGIDVPKDFFGYASPLVILQSLGLFAFIDGKSFKGQMPESVKSLDRCSFGIYLIHMIFVRLIFKYMHFNPYKMLPVLSIPICAICIFALSYLVARILKMIPGLKKVI